MKKEETYLEFCEKFNLKKGDGKSLRLYYQLLNLIKGAKKLTECLGYENISVAYFTEYNSASAHVFVNDNKGNDELVLLTFKKGELK